MLFFPGNSDRHLFLIFSVMKALKFFQWIIIIGDIEEKRVGRWEGGAMWGLFVSQPSIVQSTNTQEEVHSSTLTTRRHTLATHTSHKTNRRMHSDSTPSRNTEHTRQLRVFGNERTTGRTPRDPLPQKLYSPNSFRRSSMQMPFPRLKSRVSPCLPASPSSLRPLPPISPSIHSPLFCFHFLLSFSFF